MQLPDAQRYAQKDMNLKFNKLKCPNCAKPFPLFVKPSRWILKKWYKSPDAQCPNCGRMFSIKVSIKILLIILPLILLIGIFSVELLEKIFPFNKSLEPFIYGGFVGLLCGLGLRFCYTNDGTKGNDNA
jgi:DNA-directed RNA polymerase subunit RPC12/RpoP